MTSVIKIEEYKCAVAVIQRRLHLCRLMADGSPKMLGSRPDWQPVEPPVSQEFLNSVNRVLGTSYSEQDFRNQRSKSQPRRTRALLGVNSC